MRRYETIYILHPSLGEKEINSVVENANAIITGDNGKIIELDRWGMKKLAYPIQKEPQGFYVFCDYSGTPEAVAEMERKFRIDDSVLRYMTVKTANAISEEEIAEATSNATAKLAAAEEAQATEEAETVEKAEVAEKTAAVKETKAADKTEVTEDEVVSAEKETPEPDAADETDEEQK